MSENANTNPYIEELRGQEKLPGEPKELEQLLEVFVTRVLSNSSLVGRAMELRQGLSLNTPTMRYHHDFFFEIAEKVLTKDGNPKIPIDPSDIDNSKDLVYRSDAINYFDDWNYMMQHLIVHTTDAARSEFHRLNRPSFDELKQAAKPLQMRNKLSFEDNDIYLPENQAKAMYENGFMDEYSFYSDSAFSQPVMGKVEIIHILSNIRFRNESSFRDEICQILVNTHTYWQNEMHQGRSPGGRYGIQLDKQLTAFVERFRDLHYPESETFNTLLSKTKKS